MVVVVVVVGVGLKNHEPMTRTEIQVTIICLLKTSVWEITYDPLLESYLYTVIKHCDHRFALAFFSVTLTFVLTFFLGQSASYAKGY